RIAQQGQEAATPKELARLTSLAFRLIPARHRLDLIDDAMQGRLLEARDLLAKEMPEELRDCVAPFSADKYNEEASVQENILFGKLAYGQANAQQRVGDLIRSVVDTLGMHEEVMKLGLDFEVGVAGARLSIEQRQKLAIARCLLKNPEILIVNEATSSLDSGTERTILANIREHMAGRGIIWILGRANLADQFDRVVVMDDGKIIEQGSFSDLQSNGNVFQSLLKSA
ncbi:MAG: ATP-binding cassette domain-containing protein, partial [Gammaproteobacteria bacterium]